MGRERDELEAAHRAHLRALTEARQAAECLGAMLPRGDAEARREADRAFRREMARLDAAHRAWLRAHSPGDDPGDKQHAPRSRRMGRWGRPPPRSQVGIFTAGVCRVVGGFTVEV